MFTDMSQRNLDALTCILDGNGPYRLLRGTTYSDDLGVHAVLHLACRSGASWHALRLNCHSCNGVTIPDSSNHEFAMEVTSERYRLSHLGFLVVTAPPFLAIYCRAAVLSTVENPRVLASATADLMP